MVIRRTRILAETMLLLAVLAVTGAPAVAAADCSLTAPAYANVGTPLTIEGSGFPASASVDIAFTIDGTASDEFTVQSTAAGALEIALTPEDIDIGVTTVGATAGSTCAAQVTFTVLAAGATPPPAPEPETPSGTEPAPAPPRTDAVGDLAAGGAAGGSDMAMWLMGLALLATGCTGLFLTRTAKRP